MEAVSWVDNYPSGVIVVNADGSRDVPASTNFKTSTNVAKERLSQLLTLGSTHKMPPISLDVQVAEAQVPSQPTTESFANRYDNSVPLLALFFILFGLFLLRCYK